MGADKASLGFTLIPVYLCVCVSNNGIKSSVSIVPLVHKFNRKGALCFFTLSMCEDARCRVGVLCRKVYTKFSHIIQFDTSYIDKMKIRAQ